MTTKTYAAWVAPIAARDEKGRAELIGHARSVSQELWSRPSPLQGWTCKDLLAHLAGDTGKWFRHILRAVANGEQLDLACVGPQADIDALNARDVEERRRRSVAELIAEIEEDGEEHRELLARFDEGHQDVRLAGYDINLVSFLSDNLAGNRGGHDEEHSEHLRSRLEE